MKNISLLAVAVSLALTGCGGSDESGSSTTSSTTKSPTTTTVKVIDGYLVNAEVYVDRNDNGKPESDEKLDGLTNTSGEITLDNSDTQYGLIIRAIAGKTYDQDKAGRLTKTIELSADAGTTTVTPFTTAAKAQNMSVSDLAASLNLSEDVIAGDYTASDSDAAIQAHLYARSIAQYLTDDSVSLSATSIGTAITEVDTAIKTISGTDLATKYVDRSGTVQNMPPTVEAFLVDHTYSLASTNKSLFAGDLIKNGDAVPTVSFKADKLEVGGKSSPIKYGDNGFYMTEDGQTVHEELAFRGEKLGLAFTAQNDLNLYTEEDIAAGFTAIPATDSMFSGQTFYHIFDNSTNSDPQPAYVTFIFNSDYTLTIKEDSKSDRSARWFASGTTLAMYHADDEDNTWHIRPVFNEDSMIVAYEGLDSKTIPRFFIKNKDMADNIYAQWNTRVSE
jgi:hypothetical protein